MNDELNSSRPTESATHDPLSGNDENALARSLRDLAASSLHSNFPGADACPEPDEWFRLAGKTIPTAEADTLLHHAAVCAECATQLRLAVQALSVDSSPQELDTIEGLPTASTRWQGRLAGQLARTPARVAHRSARRYFLWGGAGLAAALLFTTGLVIMWQRQNAPERLLAQAYTDSRTFSLRIPGAGYAPIAPSAHLRGDATGREPVSLLSARTQIERHLERTPQDRHWLQLEGRADLIEEKYDAAIDILDRLVASGPVTSSLLVDDASAYFQRGIATDSQNDRATALDNLRRADEISPDDPVVLFNEAIVMEDRGQVMNAVETWNRYLRFERNPEWLAAGRRRLQSLQAKLNQLKSHRSRVMQHLATPSAMRALAAAPAALDQLDEELSTTLLPRLLNAAFPLPVDRSRGSPCPENCQAARILLDSLAVSLLRNHHDPWLASFLPSASSPPQPEFIQAAHALAQAIDADAVGDYRAALQSALKARLLFHRHGVQAGEDRAEFERIYALQRLSQMEGCDQAARALLLRDPQFAWIRANSLTEQGICDSGPGAATNENPNVLRAASIAQDHHFALLEMRARNLIGGAAVEAGDAEDAWRIDLATLRRFYAGDFPPFRAYTILAGLAEVEKSTPRAHLELLLQREVVGLLQLTRSRDLLPSQRFDLAIAAIRAGYIPEAQQELRMVQDELARDGSKSNQAFLADSEIAMANLYLTRGNLAQAATTLDSAHNHMAGVDDEFEQRAYAAARGQLTLALGHPDKVEPMLRQTILNEERRARSVGADNIMMARQNRSLYAVLAGVWLAQGRPAQDVLALWERYRLRILGRPVPVCQDESLVCQRPQLESALQDIGSSQVLGQIVLLDRTLLYRATAHSVVWRTVSSGQEELLAAAQRLELAASSPTTSQDSVSAAARRVGALLLDGLSPPSSVTPSLLLESDPLLGNLPWAAVETAGGSIGLQFNLEEAPSLLLGRENGRARSGIATPSGTRSLIVGASFASNHAMLLPEVLTEARSVARLIPHSTLLLGGQATRAQLLTRLQSTPILHFAGHTTREDGATRLLLAPVRPGLAGEPYVDSNLLRKYPPLRARLVVFSACASGRQQEGWNHGMGDIVDTLASLGVPQVVATRWQIDSYSAVPMMDAFYEGLARGLTVPQALTAARQSLIRDPRYRHPYYWAAYYASGWGQPSLRTVFHAGGQ
jgi:tetratricopeptide (TPR) repeat protein